MLIVNYGNEILETPTENVTEFDEELVKFVDEMISTMKESNGVGLAAPQVNDSRRVCIVDLGFPEGFVYDGDKAVTADYYPLVLVNPQIVVVSEAKEVMNEGCLSFPGVTLSVKRPTIVKVKFNDLEGNERYLECAGGLSRCIQHEVDHLDGVLFNTRAKKIKNRDAKVIRTLRVKNT
jgi:peptide deformylase